MQALELPIKAPSNDLRVMVEEKLRAMNRNSQNAQVIVDLYEEGTENLSLQDEGQFCMLFPQFFLLMVVGLYGVLKRKLRKQSYNNHFQHILKQSKRG